MGCRVFVNVAFCEHICVRQLPRLSCGWCITAEGCPERYCSGFEGIACVWSKPDTGEISPVIFNPLLPESGAILEIGDWV